MCACMYVRRYVHVCTLACECMCCVLKTTHTYVNVCIRTVHMSYSLSL